MARGKVASHVTGRRHQAREGAPGSESVWVTRARIRSGQVWRDLALVDQQGNGAITFTVPRLPPGRYAAVLWCPGCAERSSGTNLACTGDLTVTSRRLPLTGAGCRAVGRGWCLSCCWSVAGCWWPVAPGPGRPGGRRSDRGVAGEEETPQRNIAVADRRLPGRCLPWRVACTVPLARCTSRSGGAWTSSAPPPSAARSP
jgi:hypothetical protein